MAKALPAELANLEGLNAYSRSLAGFLRDLKGKKIRSEAELKGQLLTFNGLVEERNKFLEARLVEAGRRLLQSADAKDVHRATSAVFLFTRQYVEHEKRMAELLESKKIDEHALFNELKKQHDGILPFILAVEGVDAGLAAKINKSLKLSDAKSLLVSLKQKIKAAPSRIKNSFAELFSALDTFFSVMDVPLPYGNMKLQLFPLVVAVVALAVAWVFLAYAMVAAYSLAYGAAPADDIIQLCVLLSALLVILGMGFLGHISSGKTQKKSL